LVTFSDISFENNYVLLTKVGIM